VSDIAIFTGLFGAYYLISTWLMLDTLREEKDNISHYVFVALLLGWLIFPIQSGIRFVRRNG
jgi:hypothetical protein